MAIVLAKKIIFGGSFGDFSFGDGIGDL
jgi:hypothetical protein